MICRALLVAVLIAFGGTPIQAEPEMSKDDAYWLKLFADVVARTKENFVTTVSTQQLVEAGLKGMLTSLDAHSMFIEPAEYTKLRNKYKGTYAGLGMEILLSNEGVKVVSAMDEGPAQKAGLRAGDMILSINGQPLQALPRSVIMDRIHKAKDLQISLEIFREHAVPFTVTLRKELIPLKPVKWRMMDKVGYIKINMFNEKTATQVELAIQDLKKKSNPLIGLVLDLRNNPGGLFDQSILVASCFLDKKEVVSVRGQKGVTVQRYHSRAADRLKNVPIVVLVNEGTASSAEILAGALQDHKRALVMGQRTCGKGSIQTIFPLTRHKSAMQITTGEYFTPQGRSLHKKGVLPDVLIENAVVISKEKVLENGKTIKTIKRSSEDLTIARAMDFLVGYNMYRYHG